MGLVSSILFLCVLVASVLCKTNFTQPPANGPNANYQDNPVYQQGQKIDVQWRSDLETMDLIVFQQYPAAGKGVQFLKKLREGTRSTSLIWTVNLEGLSKKVPKGENAILYFAVLRAQSPDKDGMSHYFNVSMPDTTSAISSATQTSSVSTMSMTISSATTDVPSSTTTPEPESPGESGSGSGLSKGGVAGVAVGSTIGGILLLGGIGLLAWRKMQSGKPAEDAQVSEAKPPEPELAGPAIHEAPSTAPSEHHHQPHAAPIYEAP